MRRSRTTTRRVLPTTCFLVAALLLGLCLPGAAASPSPTGCSSESSDCLSVLTYNVKMPLLAPKLRNIHSRARAEQMIRHIVEPDRQNPSRIGELDEPVDVVILQEVVKKIPSRTLIEGPKQGLTQGFQRQGGLEDTFGHHTRRSPGAFKSQGVVILSRHPIQKRHYRQLPGGHWIVHVRIDKGGDPYHVFGVHLSSAGGSGRCRKHAKTWRNSQEKEVEELRDFVGRHAGNQPAIIAGDFNIGVGLPQQPCSRVNRRNYERTLEMLQAVEPVHPEGTENHPPPTQARVLDHVLVRNMPLSKRSFATRLEFTTQKAKIGVNGNNLSDHDPVYAVLEKASVPSQCRAPAVSWRSKKEAGFSLSPEFGIRLGQDPQCPLRLQWRIMADTGRGSGSRYATFDTAIDGRDDDDFMARSSTYEVTEGKLKPATVYQRRVSLVPRDLPQRHWPPGHHRDGVWSPAPIVTSATRRFATFDPRPDDEEPNDTKSTATVLQRDEWSHQHMVCPEQDGFVSTRTEPSREGDVTGSCGDILQTTQLPSRTQQVVGSSGRRPAFVAYERWTLEVEDLTLDDDDTDRDRFLVELPKLDFQDADLRRLAQKPCTDLRKRVNGRSITLRTSVGLGATLVPQPNEHSEAGLNDPLGVPADVEQIDCASAWDDQGRLAVRIGPRQGPQRHWGGYRLVLSLEIRLSHGSYDDEVDQAQREIRKAREIHDAPPLGIAAPLDTDCLFDPEGPCASSFQHPRLPAGRGGARPDPAPRLDCEERACREGIPFRVEERGRIELTAESESRLSFRLLDREGKVIAESEPTTQRPSSKGATTMVALKGEGHGQVARTRTQRLTAEDVEPGPYVLVIEGRRSEWVLQRLSLPGRRPGSRPTPEPPGQTASESARLTLIPKAGAFLAGASSLEDVSGELGAVDGDQRSVFTWGASVAIDARDGPVDLRLTGLRTTGSLVSTAEGAEPTSPPRRKSILALTGDVVLRPLPRLLVQPYLVTGAGGRRLTSSGGSGSSQDADPRWDATVQVGGGVDLRLGGITVGLEAVDYVTGLMDQGNGTQHDVFALFTLGVALD